jgi:FkbM family methyltransferase
MIKNWLLRRGAILSRPPGQFNVFSYKLAGAKRRGLEIKSALDGGAATGGWIREIRAVYPQAKVLAVEPREEVQGELRQVQSELGGVEIAQTLLSDTEGEAMFYVQGDWSSMDKDFVENATSMKFPVTTIDRLVERLGFPHPDLIKLDLQGSELAALDGATECLKHAKAVLLEVSFIDFKKGMPLIGDVLSYLKGKGYVAYDVLGLWHRPLDGAMAQGDILFVPESSPLRRDRRYFSDQRPPVITAKDLTYS